MNTSTARQDPVDWRAHVMQVPVFCLGEWLWKESWDHLSPHAKMCPPTGCQVLFYFKLFGGKQHEQTQGQWLDEEGEAARFQRQQTRH